VTEQENAPADGLEGDPISQDQAALDAEQGGIAAPDYVSREDFVRMQSTYQQQIAGLQSKVDTGLNAIRRDTQVAAEERINAEKARVREEYYGSLREISPEQEQAQRRHDDYMDGLERERAKVTAQPTPAPVETQAAPANDQAAWEQIFGMVRDFGVDPNDPRVDYRALVDQNLTEASRRQRFMQSVRAAVTPAASAAAPTPQKPNGAAPHIVTPPVEGAPQRGGGYRNADDVHDAFISGNIIDREQYKAALAKFGQ
jgi:hypothetical protein